MIPDSSTISETSVDLTGLPSKEYQEEETEEVSLIEAAKEKVVFSEYIRSKFGSYTAPKEDTKLTYEAEYILSGKNTDKENLSSTIEKLMLLREGSNLIYLLKDTEKRSEAYQMAVTLVGFTGMPLLITVTQF